MNIVIIGTGNVATILGRKFKKAGHTILQVVGRNSAAASKLAYELNTVSTNYRSSINNNADIYIVAVSDNAITDVIEDLKLPGKVIAHTAAAAAKEILKPVSEHYGVFYPLQTLRKEMAELPDTPLFFDGNDEKAKTILEKLAHSIAGENVVQAGNDERIKLHIAAVFASNFTNYMYMLAEEYCQKEGIDFNLLHPLIEETALRIKTVSPAEVQTGPAIRHDDETIKKHLALLKSHPQLQKVYTFLSESIGQLK
jgi:predicted short-subunit dehydrogenase-like oxidoreductase (DUF2520 family)